jgi:hypothetical protein
VEPAAVEALLGADDKDRAHLVEQTQPPEIQVAAVEHMDSRSGKGCGRMVQPWGEFKSFHPVFSRN